MEGLLQFDWLTKTWIAVNKTMQQRRRGGVCVGGGGWKERGQREQHELQNLIMMVSKATHSRNMARHLAVPVNLQQQPAYSQALTDIL